MKTVKMILLGILCVFFAACEKNNDDDSTGSGDGPGGGTGSGNNKLKTGQIEIKVEPNSGKKITFTAVAKKNNNRLGSWAS